MLVLMSEGLVAKSVLRILFFKQPMQMKLEKNVFWKIGKN